MLGTLALLALFQAPAVAQELAPGVRYDPSIPTLGQVAGHDFGEEITAPTAGTRTLSLRRERMNER